MALYSQRKWAVWPEITLSDNRPQWSRETISISHWGKREIPLRESWSLQFWARMRSSGWRAGNVSYFPSPCTSVHEESQRGSLYLVWEHTWVSKPLLHFLVSRFSFIQNLETKWSFHSYPGCYFQCKKYLGGKVYRKVCFSPGTSYVN